MFSLRRFLAPVGGRAPVPAAALNSTGPLLPQKRHMSQQSLLELKLPDRVGFTRFEDENEDIAGVKLLRQKWTRQPRNILLVARQKETTSLVNRDFINEMASHLYATYPGTTLVVDEQLKDHFQGLPYLGTDRQSIKDMNRTIDIIVAVGGGNAVLRASALFQRNDSDCPPVISFHTQTEKRGFLSPFSATNFRYSMEKVMGGNFSLTERTRLESHVFDEYDTNRDSFTYLNELVLHRGSTFNLLSVDCFAFNNYMTTCVGDGMILSTPTGSTAYSLSCGGSMIHPSIRTIALASICPFSMSARPALLPSSVKFGLQLSSLSRKNLLGSPTQPVLTMDGHNRFQFGPLDRIEVRESRRPLYTVNDTTETRDWISDLNQTIRWNRLLHPTFSSYSPEDS